MRRAPTDDWTAIRVRCTTSLFNSGILSYTDDDDAVEGGAGGAEGEPRGDVRGVAALRARAAGGGAVCAAGDGRILPTLPARRLGSKLSRHAEFRGS